MLVIDDKNEGLPLAGQAVVAITVPIGETVTKYWYFDISASGKWEHWLNDEEVELLNGALASR